MRLEIKARVRGASRVTLSRRQRSVALTVEDDGRGFSRARGADGGFGLIGTRERVAAVNGALDIESESGAGTRIAIELPLPGGE